MKSFLSGMPELKLGLNDKLYFSNAGKRSNPSKEVELDDIKLHQCVRLSRFENDRTISFIPPDGTASYSPSTNSFNWLIDQFNGSSNYTLKAKFGLSKILREDRQTSKAETLFAKLSFEIPYYTVSGIQVRYLKIFEKSGYAALPWVRYSTRNGNYIVKIDPWDFE